MKEIMKDHRFHDEDVERVLETGVRGEIEIILSERQGGGAFNLSTEDVIALAEQMGLTVIK